MTTVRTGTVQTPDGLALAFDEAGSGEPVLLVHGIGLSRRRWQAQVDTLVDRGYRAVRFDLRGFGDSQMPPSPYRIEDLVADIEAVVEQLHLERFHLVGHSLGGMISQLFAVRHPEALRSLALASTTAHNGERASAFARAMSRISEAGFDAAVQEPDLRLVVEAVLAQAFPDGGAPPLRHFRNGLEEPNLAHAYAWAATAGFTVKERLGEIACPVLVLHGGSDPLIPCRLGRWIHEAIAHSSWVEFPGAGHSIQVERADAFNEALSGLLDPLR